MNCFDSGAQHFSHTLLILIDSLLMSELPSSFQLVLFSLYVALLCDCMRYLDPLRQTGAALRLAVQIYALT